VPRPLLNPTFVALAPFAEAVVGVVLVAVGAPGWCYLLIVSVGTMPVLIMSGYAIRAVLISRSSAMGVREALQQYRPEFVVYYAPATACAISSACSCPTSSVSIVGSS
jgi:hypothetical protein